MKIARTIREAYTAGEGRARQLRTEIRERLKPKVEESEWFYIDRIKQLESFALKVETGRVSNLGKMEDFFACTVIVPTLGRIEAAELLVGGLFEIVERRPPNSQETHKPASEFTFDDLRLYVRLRPALSGRPSGSEGILFEVQIKTSLQYAWGIATHELIYKTDEVSWPKQRIAFQVKAMLEHAELAISEARQLSSASAVSKQDRRTKDILTIIEQVRGLWHGESLPTDLKRLAESIAGLLSAGDVPIEQLHEILDAERRRIGVLPVDLSPYSFVVQALANCPNFDFERNFKRRRRGAVLIIHDGMDLPRWMHDEHDRIIDLTPPRTTGASEATAAAAEPVVS
jgi:hypothetical protein